MAGFNQLCQDLRNELEVVKAEKEVAEELRQIMEKKLKQSIARVTSLEKELKIAESWLVNSETN